MTKPHTTEENKKNRKKRHKTNEQFYLGELETDLKTAQQRVRFYSLTVDMINELAMELTGVDLLKKTGHELSKRSQRQEL